MSGYFSANSPLFFTRSFYINRFKVCHEFRDCTGRQHPFILEYTSESVQQTLVCLENEPHFSYALIVTDLSALCDFCVTVFGATHQVMNIHISKSHCCPPVNPAKLGNSAPCLKFCPAYGPWTTYGNTVEEFNNKPAGENSCQ